MSADYYGAIPGDLGDNDPDLPPEPGPALSHASVDATCEQKGSRPMTLHERLSASNYAGKGGTHYELFQPGSGATIRVALFTDGAARVSAFDGQMSWKWSADFTADVDDALILNFLDAAETLG